ncbi:type II toxin-antitoxin system ParD family antitoxin [Aestuariivirga sp.]|uniref:ribbon-helix-helix domain-containing protein n=1 Tax=Aestuariivirga sp. TaxID=2650926 RepID=UPI0025C433C3|nr:type II toxin-antitoxin system ParD family antitoxin [Aestuariivirga sp.]
MSGFGSTSNVRIGKYQNASEAVREAVRDAVRGWQERLKADELKLERLRQSITAGVAALDRGEYEDVEDEDLNTFLDGLATPAAR